MRNKNDPKNWENERSVISINVNEVFSFMQNCTLRHITVRTGMLGPKVRTLYEYDYTVSNEDTHIITTPAIYPAREVAKLFRRLADKLEEEPNESNKAKL